MIRDIYNQLIYCIDLYCLKLGWSNQCVNASNMYFFIRYKYNDTVMNNNNNILSEPYYSQGDISSLLTDLPNDNLKNIIERMTSINIRCVIL